MKVVVSTNPEQAGEILKLDRFIFRESLRLVDGEELRAEVYRIESSKRRIGLGGVKFPAVVQNSLLKLLEEPPPNVQIYLIVPSKYQLLPTIRSRLPIKTLPEVVEEDGLVEKLEREGIGIEGLLEELEQEELFPFQLPPNRWSGMEFLEFLKSKPTREQVKKFIYKLADGNLSRLSAEEWEGMGVGIQLLELYGDPEAVAQWLYLLTTQSQK